MKKCNLNVVFVYLFIINVYNLFPYPSDFVFKGQICSKIIV